MRLFLVIRGPSAVGKSALTRVIAGLLLDKLLPRDEALCIVHGDYLTNLTAGGGRNAAERLMLRSRSFVSIVGHALVLDMHCIIEDVFPTGGDLRELLALATSAARKPLVVRLNACRETLLSRNRSRDPMDFVSDERVVSYAHQYDQLAEMEGEVVLDVDGELLGTSAERLLDVLFREVPWLNQEDPKRRFHITVERPTTS